MRSISIFLLVALINLWIGCYNNVLVKPSNSFYQEELNDYPKIAVYTNDKKIYEFDENQYQIKGDILDGVGCLVIADTSHSKLGGYIRDNIMWQESENVVIELSQIDHIEYAKISNSKTIIAALLAGLAIVTIVLVIDFATSRGGGSAERL